MTPLFALPLVAALAPARPASDLHFGSLAVTDHTASSIATAQHDVLPRIVGRGALAVVHGSLSAQADDEEVHTRRKVVYAMHLVMRTQPNYNAEPTGVVLEMGDFVVSCPHPTRRRTHAASSEDGAAEVKWHYVTKDGNGCDDAGWIPLQHPVTGKCLNFAGGDAPTCWDFYNWEMGIKIPEGTTQTACPRRINHLRSRHAEDEYDGLPIGSAAPWEECLELSLKAAFVGSVAKLGGMTLNLGRVGVSAAAVGASGSYAMLTDWKRDAPPRMRKHAPKIAKGTIAAATAVNAFVPSLTVAFPLAATAGFLTCMWLTGSRVSAAYPTCHHPPWKGDTSISMRTDPWPGSWVMHAFGGTPHLVARDRDL